MTKMKRLLGLLAATAMVLVMGVGCGAREHIRDDHGVANKKFFKKQRIFAEAAQGAPEGLDSEEAALIQAAHRKNMGGQGAAEARDSPAKVLLVQETKK